MPSLLVDLVVESRVIAVERFCYRTTDDRLHLVRERLELLVPPVECVRGVEDDLAFEPAHPAERIRDRVRRHGKEDDLRVRRIAPVATELRHRVACLLPAARQPAAEFPLPMTVIFMAPPVPSRIEIQLR